MKPNRLALSLLLILCLAMTSISGCARIKIQTQAVTNCNVVPFNQQSEAQHVLRVTSLRGNSESSASSNSTQTDNRFKVKYAKELLEQATKIAQEGEGNDFRCRVTLKLSPESTSDEIVPKLEIPSDVRVSECVKEGNICTKNDFDDVLRLHPPGIKIVNRIDWCGQPVWGGFYGCTKRGGHSMIVVSDCRKGHCPRDEHVLWLHEAGHMQGIPDLRNSDPRPAVMKSRITRQNTQLTKCDCMRLRKNLRR